MKIAIFSKDLAIGGIQKSLVNLLNSLDYSKMSVDLYLLNDVNFYSDSLNKEVKIKKLKKMSNIFSYLPFNIAKYIYKPLINETYDIAIDFSGEVPETALAAYFVSPKRFVFCHTEILKKMSINRIFKFKSIMHKSKINIYDDVIAVSRRTLDEFNEFYKRSGGFIVPNIIDDMEIRKDARESASLRISKKYFNLVSMGSFTPAKGFDLLVDLMSEVKRRDLRLYLIGGGKDYRKIKRLIFEKDLEDKVFLLGKLANPYPYLNRMDAFISLSRYEGGSISLLEAKALGLDVIIPKRLEPDSKLIKGTDSVINKLERIKRKPKDPIKFKEYNEEALNKFYEAIGVEL